MNECNPHTIAFGARSIRSDFTIGHFDLHAVGKLNAVRLEVLDCAASR
jgi:hypothetical protein